MELRIYPALQCGSSGFFFSAGCGGITGRGVATYGQRRYPLLRSGIRQGVEHVQAKEKSLAGIMEALAAGRYYATQGPAFHQVEITGRTVRVCCSPVESIVFYSNVPWTPNRSQVGHALTEATYELTDRENFIRVQLTDAQGKHAWSNPVARQWIR